MPPNPYQIGMNTVFTFNFILKFHLQFHSLPCKVAYTLQVVQIPAPGTLVRHSFGKQGVSACIRE